MNKELIKALKERMPDFSDNNALSNLEVRATKKHEREGKYNKQLFNNFSQALSEIEIKLKAKHKLAPELCRATAGRFIIVFELPVSESKKVLESALQAAREEYNVWISRQQEDWLNEQLEEALQEQAQADSEKQEKANTKFKESLIEALQSK